MRLENLARAIASATRYLEDSIKFVSRSDDKDVSDLVWKVATELEYALFLFSITHQNESESSSWKLGLHSKEVEVESILASTRDLLEEAETGVKEGELHEAHKKTWMARGYILKLQEFFEKRKKLEKTAVRSS